MWGLAGYFKTLLGYQKTPKIDEEEYIRALSDESAEEYILRELHQRKCTDYKGRITQLNDRVAVIDHQYYFHLKNSCLVQLKVGDKVKCKLYTNELSTLIKNIEKIPDDEELTEPNVKPLFEPTPSPSDGIPRITLCGKITSKEVRNVTVLCDPECSYPKVEFSLDSVRAEFIPIIGDIVDLEGIEREGQGTDEKKFIVEKVSPKRAAVKLGTVTEWNDVRGVISNFAEFSILTCEPGYQPTVGDKVLASYVWSEQKGYKWRAVQVVPQCKQTDSRLSKKDEEARRDLLRDKNGIFISESTKVEVTLNEETNITFEVVNKENTSRVLNYCNLLSLKELSQIKLIHPQNHRNIDIEPDQVIQFEFSVTGKFLGRSSEQCVWVFDDFKIGRIIDIEVKNTLLTEDEGITEGGTPLPRKDVTASQLIDRSSGVIMPGRRSFSPAAFVPVKLGQFSLSEKILIAALPDNKMNLDDLMIRVEKVLPCLKEDLQPRTYHSRMHGLLYLEEVAMLKQVGELEMDQAVFRRYGDCLILDVPALSPYTTKLVAGDMLIARIPWAEDSDLNRKYEGVIHRVTHTELWLQFAKDFHDSYVDGMKYAVSFVTSRASLRRMHQAINLAVKHLGMSWLFPMGVHSRPYQVIIEDGEGVLYQKTTYRHREVVEEVSKSISTHFHNKIKHNNFGNQSQRELLALHSPDPRKLTPEIPMNKLKVEQKPSSVVQTKGFGMRRGGIRDINWNRHGSGYGMHCTVDNECKVKISLEQKKKIRWFNAGLNSQQREAVRNVLLGEARPLPYVIFGPPGTGKTVTVVETILQLHALIPESRLLVATPSNSAADLIAERLLETGDLKQGDLLRMVGYHYLEQGRIAASIVPYSAVPDVKAINVSGASGASHEGVQMCGRELLGQHRITVGTLGCLGLLYNMGFPRGHFTHVIVDEAGQATEPEVLIPMIFLHMHYGQVVLAGDPLQLGPVVTSRLASRCGLQDSLLARLLNRFPYTRDPSGFPESSGYDPRLVTKLVNNYRSLPKILKLPSMLFYDNDLVPNVSEIDSEEAQVLRAIGETLPCHQNGMAPPLLFHGVRGTNQQEAESHSWYNPEEVIQAIMYLNTLYAAGLRSDQVGIITPYQLQSNKIRFTLEKMGIEPPKVGSVEEFQGQEKMAIIVSVVRSSPELITDDMQKALGFVANARRLNVALSRARAVLIILGNPHLLSLDMHWRSVLRHCVINNVYQGSDLPEDFKMTETSDNASSSIYF